MSAITKFRDWTASHNPKWLALIRVALGAALLLRGVNFLDNTAELQTSIDASVFQSHSEWIAHAIPWIHIGGGFLIIIGLFTRFASLIQMPVLIGAVFFINSKKGFFTTETSLPYSIIILLLLIVFLIEGSGMLSLAQYFREAEQPPTQQNSSAA
ncbi:MAG TPA: DoxX family membrane protein [Ferruginibacter sp.]|nr:DoxX family membrane protein [Ferruginibacter sp.]HMP22144.1 DoxX family membrane protein [Ferruginibacter sp.]